MLGSNATGLALRVSGILGWSLADIGLPPHIVLYNNHMNQCTKYNVYIMFLT